MQIRYFGHLLDWQVLLNISVYKNPQKGADADEGDYG